MIRNLQARQLIVPLQIRSFPSLTPFGLADAALIFVKRQPSWHMLSHITSLGPWRLPSGHVEFGVFQFVQQIDRLLGEPPIRH